MDAVTDADDAPARTVDAEQFGGWVAQARVPMTRLARRLAPHADPEDLVQDALARAWTKRHQFTGERGSSTSWLLAVVADRARASRRTRVRWLRLLDDRAEVPDAGAADQPVDVDLERALAELTDRQQLAVHLHYFVGLTVDVTAEVMGCAPGTVKSTLHDARTRLRTLLGDDDD